MTDKPPSQSGNFDKCFLDIDVEGSLTKVVTANHGLRMVILLILSRHHYVLAREFLTNTPMSVSQRVQVKRIRTF
jgi:hypothetical protein